MKINMHNDRDLLLTDMLENSKILATGKGYKWKPPTGMDAYYKGRKIIKPLMHISNLVQIKENIGTYCHRTQGGHVEMDPDDLYELSWDLTVENSPQDKGRRMAEMIRKDFDKKNHH